MPKSYDYVLVILAVFLVQGCASPYEKYYVSKTGGVDIRTMDNIIVSDQEPIVIRGSIAKQDHANMLESNFGLIGYSNFNAARVDENLAVVQAKKLGAAAVIVNSSYSGTVTGVSQITTPDIRTSTTNVSGSTSNFLGGTNFAATGTTTNYGTKTTLMPYSVDRADYFAAYYAKLKPRIFGANVGPLPQEIRQKFGSNQGVYVEIVITGSPAFKADIVSGDVIKKIGDVDISIGDDGFFKSITLQAGKETTVTLMRGDKEIVKNVKMNSQP